MRVLSGLDYQERLNPWINKGVHVAHGVPLAFPAFRLAVANEVFLFVVAILFVAAMFVGIALVFSLPIFNSGSFNGNIVPTPKKFEAITIFSIFLIAYFRVAYFILGKLNHELLIAILSFLVTMSIPYIAEGMPALEAWLGGKALNYSNPSSPTLIMVFLLAYAITQKLLRQFHEAKAKNTSKAN